MALVIRRATPHDLPAVSELAGALVRMHHDADPARFFLPPDVENGYRFWLGREIKRQEAVILVAADGPDIAGYAYGALAERDWNLLLDAHGAIHDVFVAPAARRTGIGRRLVEAMCAALTELGAPRIVLSTMVANAAAQRVFQACGFRPTMLEMTRESKAPST